MKGTLVLAAVGGLLLLACGGAPPNYYRSATAKQQKCCEALADPAARSACLGEVPRIEEAEAQTNPTNQSTFRCVNQHFQCDALTGKASKESAQAQLDCINDLESQ